MLQSGLACHNYLYFYRFSIDAALRYGDVATAVRYADALERHTQRERLGWSEFHVARARALAAYMRASDARRRAALEAIYARATAHKFFTAAKVIARALDPVG